MVLKTTPLVPIWKSLEVSSLPRILPYKTWPLICRAPSVSPCVFVTIILGHASLRLHCELEGKNYASEVSERSGQCDNAVCKAKSGLVLFITKPPFLIKNHAVCSVMNLWRSKRVVLFGNAGVDAEGWEAWHTYLYVASLYTWGLSSCRVCDLGSHISHELEIKWSSRYKNSVRLHRLVRC